MNPESGNTQSSHVIRLRGPCNLTMAVGDTQIQPIRVRIPGKISEEIFPTEVLYDQGSVFLHRKFNKPTGLVMSQIATLNFCGFTNVQRASLNPEADQVVAVDVDSGAETFSIDVTDKLLPHNKIEIEFKSLPSFAGEIELVLHRI